MISRVALLVAVAASFIVPATAEEVGVGVGPVGVTVGSDHDHDHDRIVHEREVVREHEHRGGDQVIIKKDRPDVVEKKTIIHDHD